jgi:hypothetical protein
MADTRQLTASTIGGELLRRREGRPALHRLEFDPASGELRLRVRDERLTPSAETTYVDQIASDGFA